MATTKKNMIWVAVRASVKYLEKAEINPIEFLMWTQAGFRGIYIMYNFPCLLILFPVPSIPLPDLIKCILHTWPK